MDLAEDRRARREGSRLSGPLKWRSPDADVSQLGASESLPGPARSDNATTSHHVTIALSSIKDGGAQMRLEMGLETVLEYAEDMLAGAVFPPVVVYFDGKDHWLGDGYHRVEAARKAELEEILAEIRQGTARDALLHGIGANAFHGLKRNQADRRRAVVTLLRDPEWSNLSDRKLGDIANVDHKTVGKIRRELSGEIPHGGSLSRESPRLRGKPNGSGSIMADVLRSLSDSELIEECRRRGLTVEAGDA